MRLSLLDRDSSTLSCSLIARLSLAGCSSKHAHGFQGPRDLNQNTYNKVRLQHPEWAKNSSTLNSSVIPSGERALNFLHAHDGFSTLDLHALPPCRRPSV